MSELINSYMLTHIFSNLNTNTIIRIHFETIEIEIIFQLAEEVHVFFRKSGLLVINGILKKKINGIILSQFETNML